MVPVNAGHFFQIFYGVIKTSLKVPRQLKLVAMLISYMYK